VAGEEKAALLAAIDFFKGCTARQIEDIAKLAGERYLDAGDVLCRQGDHESDVFVFVDGEASAHRDGAQIGTVRRGEVVGELAMMTGGHRTATLKATTALHVLVLDPREVDSVLSADPSSSRRLGHHSE
jgi:CRP-like cAMP-binding protein